MAEYMTEYEFRRPREEGKDYAGSLTLGDIEAIKAEAERVRQRRAAKNGTAPA